MSRVYSGIMRSLILTLWVLFGLMTGFPVSAAPGPQSDALLSVPIEDYAIYDRVIEAKFLTSQTSVVLVNRVTVTSLTPDGRPTTLDFFTDGRYFGGGLPRELVVDFLMKSGRPSRLEARFALGVKVLFVSDDEVEEQEASIAPMPVHQTSRPVQWGPEKVGVLFLSRIGLNTRGDQALLFIGEDRPDGGGGYLVWLRRTDSRWEIHDTEVLWTAEYTEDLEEER